MESKYCHNTIITKIIIAIAKMIIVIDKDVEFAITQL